MAHRIREAMNGVLGVPVGGNGDVKVPSKCVHRQRCRVREMD